MDRNIKRIGLINWLALLAGTVGMMFIARYANSAAGLMGAILGGLGLVVALLSYCQMSLEGREQLEKLELDEMSKSRGAASLFAAAGEDTFPARRSREQFERYFIPGLTVLLFLLECAAAYFPWRHGSAVSGVDPMRAPLALALFGLLGLILFILGKYSSGLARLQKQRLLRPGAAYLLLSAYASWTTAATMAAVYFNFSRVDYYVGRVLCVVVGLIALETLMGLVLEIYRVRLKGKEVRLLYESRLVGLLGQPEALISTAAHALDYQFGFKVSETWFYRFLEKAFAWLVLAQLGILVLSTCIAVIPPGEQALLERCGRPVGRGVIGPGLHFKLPWPVDQVYRYPTERIQSFIVGAEPETLKTIQWTVPHAKEENFLVANRSGELAAGTTNQTGGHPAPPVSLLSVSIPVQFQITNLTNWAYKNQDPAALLATLSRRVVARFLAGAEMTNLMSAGRGEAADTLRRIIQEQSDELDLGVRIVFVGLEDIHPPVKVAGEYEKVVSERESREVKILDAQAHAISTNALARGASTNLVVMAEADKFSTTINAVARAELFAKQSLAFAAAPGPDGVYEHWAYLDVLAKTTHEALKKIINATGDSPQIFEFNEEPKIRDLGSSLIVPKENK
ncbi:MAG: SPFH domain-containing protein [Verrucomicrobiota bacterium]|jgi:regulator of protease activity HflC (stomatin/prohibitin superfamily)